MGIYKCHMQNLHDLHVWQDETESHLLDHQKLKANLHETVPKTFHRQYNPASVIILTSSLLKSWFVSRYFKSIIMGKSQKNGYNY